MMERPRISAVPLALAAASLFSSRDAAGMLDPGIANTYDERDARMQRYLGDVTRYVRAMIQQQCLDWLGRAIESEYHNEDTYGTLDDTSDGSLRHRRDVTVNEGRRDCANGVTNAVDRRIGARRNIDVEFGCGSVDWAEDPTACSITASYPRWDSPNSHPR